MFECLVKLIKPINVDAKSLLKVNMRVYCLALAFFTFLSTHGQSYYFPPAEGTWKTTPIENLDYKSQHIDELLSLLDERNSKSFIMLIHGKIVIEAYFDNFTQDSIWYWASCGKSLMSALVGIAQDNNLFTINDITSEYLGTGWTSLMPEQEAKIRISHQLSMITGLDETVLNPDCVEPECLQYLADPGERWFYHNAPYRLLGDVIEATSGKSLNIFTKEMLFDKIGMKGFWYQYVMFGRARDMARFGSLVLNDGVWDGETILGGSEYLNLIRNSSQELNPAYGYLWWLNGKETFIQPGLATTFNGKLIENAPEDLYAALGKNDQKIYIVPSMDMVIVRQGDKAGDSNLAISVFDNELWKKITTLITDVDVLSTNTDKPEFYPNPAKNMIQFEKAVSEVSILDLSGKVVIFL